MYEPASGSLVPVSSQIFESVSVLVTGRSSSKPNGSTISNSILIPTLIEMTQRHKNFHVRFVLITKIWLTIARINNWTSGSAQLFHPPVYPQLCTRKEKCFSLSLLHLPLYLRTSKSLFLDLSLRFLYPRRYTTADT